MIAIVLLPPLVRAVVRLVGMAPGLAPVTGRTPPPHWDYLMAFNMFRLAAILQGIRHRALLGNASAADAQSTGERARWLAEAGWRLAQSLDVAELAR